MKNKFLSFVFILTTFGLPTATAFDSEQLLIPLATDSLPVGMVPNQVTTRMTTMDSKPVLTVDFQRVDYPNVYFQAPSGKWDWSGYAGIAVDLINRESESVRIAMRVDNEGADGIHHCNTVSGSVNPDSTTTLSLTFHTGSGEVFWGMRGLPEIGPMGTGSPLELTKITAFQVFLPRPDRPHTLHLCNFRLWGKGANLAERVPMPFVDRFGQYRHAEWQGKLHDQKEFQTRYQEELAVLQTQPSLPQLDRFGGWKEGPQLTATGYFRTEKVNGKWWLVTPEGHLFFSTGMDCVGLWEQTFVTGREKWFEWLPPMDEPSAKFFNHVEGAHSMADAIGGKGRTFGFYGANLVRKYGEDYRNEWMQTSLARFHSWGFNTIGNWSDGEICQQGDLPFVVSVNIGAQLRNLEGAKGYWGALKDVYDPRFADVVDEAVSAIAERYSANPRCIGFFSDNELSWETLQRGVLASPADQPCRQALIKDLKTKYPEIRLLCHAWSLPETTWEALRAPETLNATATEDLEQFVYEFARVYFSTIREMLRNHSPHQLYLGCRFSSYPKAVVQACAEIADVVSFNLYLPAIRPEECALAKALDKPLLIGEFHFGATDRGMFHPGLGPTRNQEERAQSYERYVQSALDCPAIVGCHWFQYVDEPITGRWFDGENYNIGFVDVTDTPYPEMVQAARKVHSEMYQRRMRQ